MAHSLMGQSHPLATVEAQRVALRPGGLFRPFLEAVRSSGTRDFRANSLNVLQMNLGKLCNQTCKHCHVDAGPDRTEVMTRATMEYCLRAMELAQIPRADLTGGAPEMNPDFRWFVEQLVARGVHVMDRCNLTILMVGKFRNLPEFFAKHGVEVVASLPYFQAAQTNAQRGDGVFETSIAAIRCLNDLGYGQPGSNLTLNLVYNPVGAFLAPKQAAIEPTFRQELWKRHGIIFNNLYVISNMPISRFLEFLLRTEQYETYMHRLIDAYNPAAVPGVMCRSMLSVGWDGRIYDCDFNQMLELPLASNAPRQIADFNIERILNREISTGLHCYGCTAGVGSGCGGAVVAER